MSSEEDIVKNQATGNLTYMSWWEHLVDFIRSHWKKFFLYLIAGFGVFWGLIEAISFFYPKSNLNNLYVFVVILGICLLGSISRCVFNYRNAVPKGLESETSTVHEIVRSKKHFWEYALAHELVKDRIEKIDQELDDIVNNRIHVKVTRTMDVGTYIQWIQTRPENLLRIVETAKQLLIFDLVNSIHANENEEIDFRNLIRVVDLIKELYRNAYDFEVEGRAIKIPEGFELVHEIQGEWISVIRDGFYQMLKILKSVATRKKGDLSPIEATITFEAPPRINEFCDELDRLSMLLES